MAPTDLRESANTMTTLTAHPSFPLNLDHFRLTTLLSGTISLATPTLIRVSFTASNYVDFVGSFRFSITGTDVEGSFRMASESYNGATIWAASGFTYDAATFIGQTYGGRSEEFAYTLLRGADRITGSSFRDNLRGYAGNDVLNGEAADDTLTGGIGNDTLLGGSGTDTAVFSANRSRYRVSRSANGGVTVRGPDGTDTLTSIERVRFGNAAPLSLATLLGTVTDSAGMLTGGA